LPQIAAHGTTHYRISKSVKRGRTVTEVMRLGQAEREEELARMIGGSEVSTAVRAGAREMLAARSTGAKGEAKAKGESESRRRRT
jgi:DNA repair protein RecN (Recombination protein N)